MTNAANKANAAAANAAKENSIKDMIAEVNATTTTTEAPAVEAPAQITFTLPAGRITAQSIISAPHATTFGVERWFKKTDLVSFKQLANKGGVEITIVETKIQGRLDYITE